MVAVTEIDVDRVLVVGVEVGNYFVIKPAVHVENRQIEKGLKLWDKIAKKIDVNWLISFRYLTYAKKLV